MPEVGHCNEVAPCNIYNIYIHIYAYIYIVLVYILYETSEGDMLSVVSLCLWHCVLVIISRWTLNIAEAAVDGHRRQRTINYPSGSMIPDPKHWLWAGLTCRILPAGDEIT